MYILMYLKKKKDSGTYCLDMSWMILWWLLLLHIHSALTVGASPHHYYLSFSFTSSCQTKLGAQCLFLALAFHSHTSVSLTMVRMNNWKHFCIGYSWITGDLYYLSFTLRLNTTLRKMCLFFTITWIKWRQTWTHIVQLHLLHHGLMHYKNIHYLPAVLH